jgi:hypothetical protein
MVTTTNGVDLSGPTSVTAASTSIAGTRASPCRSTGPACARATGTTSTVTGEADGPMRTIELGHNLDTEIAASSEVDVTLFIRKPLSRSGRTGPGSPR